MINDYKWFEMWQPTKPLLFLKTVKPWTIISKGYEATGANENMAELSEAPPPSPLSGPLPGVKEMDKPSSIVPAV